MTSISLSQIETIGNMQKVFLLFDANNSGRICRSEFQLACEKLNCPLTPAGTEVMWRKAEASGHEFVEFDELCRMFTADYKDYMTNSQKLAQSSNSVSSLAAHVGPAIERAEQHYAYN